MDESIKCECGNNEFLWFGKFVRCKKCYMEIMQSAVIGILYYRKWDKSKKCYPKEWGTKA